MKKREIVVPVEVYSRVVGYFRPVNQWNAGKQQEFRDRKTFTTAGVEAGEYEYSGRI